MIFETHLFDKEKDWLSITKDASGRRIVAAIDKEEPIEVKAGWGAEDYLLWRPMRGWFRPYRKEIIGNTICADLIDYIQRDGHYSGIISHIDLKFLDRMTITRAIIGDGGPVDLLFPWSKIAETSEHVVFDIYDHKRGFMRQSIITGILASLHARYLLCERVYQHRVVEAARAMLQKIVSLLCDAGALSAEFIHKNNSDNKAVGLIGDDILLKWVCDLDEEKYPDKKNNISAAKELANLLFDRRVYRETVIIDGIQGFDPPGTIAGGCKNCEALGDSLLPSDKSERDILEQEITDICDNLKKEWKEWGEDPNIIPKLPIIIGLREFAKRYKVPLVLVVKPHRYPELEAPLEIQPLFICQNPPHIRKQLEAMESAYDSLWRVYLFIHPIFHKKGRPARKSKSKKSPERRANELVQNEFLEFLRNRTKIGWRNSVNLSQLLPEESIDIPSFIKDENLNDILEGEKVGQILQIASKRYIKQPEKEKERLAFVDRCREPFGDLLRDDLFLLSLFLNGAGNRQLISKFENIWQQEQIPDEQKITESSDFYEKAAKSIFDALKKAKNRLI